MPWTSAKSASAPPFSRCSASTHWTSTRDSLAIPPWASASIRLLYESFRSMYLPTTAIRVVTRGAFTRRTTASQREVARARLEPEELRDDLVEPFLVEDQRDLVDGLHVLGGDDRLFLDVAEEGDLRLDPRRQVAIGTAEEDVRLDPDRAQLFHGVLGRLGLELRRRLHERHECQVDVDDVLAADVLLELSDGLEEREPLDVAHGPADLDDDDVRVPRHATDRRLDLVGDVRDHLDGTAEVIAAPLLLDHGEVDLPRRHVVVARHAARGEPLVVPEVEVGLAAVVGDEHLAVLVGTHRPRVHVDVRVHLLQRDPEAPRLQE